MARSEICNPSPTSRYNRPRPRSLSMASRSTRPKTRPSATEPTAPSPRLTPPRRSHSAGRSHPRPPGLGGRPEPCSDGCSDRSDRPTICARTDSGSASISDLEGAQGPGGGALLPSSCITPLRHCFPRRVSRLCDTATIELNSGGLWRARGCSGVSSGVSERPAASSGGGGKRGEGAVVAGEEGLRDYASGPPGCVAWIRIPPADPGARLQTSNRVSLQRCDRQLSEVWAVFYFGYRIMAALLSAIAFALSAEKYALDGEHMLWPIAMRKACTLCEQPFCNQIVRVLYDFF